MPSGVAKGVLRRGGSLFSLGSRSSKSSGGGQDDAASLTPERCMIRAHKAERREQFKEAIDWNMRALEQLDKSSWKAAECLDALTKEHWRLGNLDKALTFGKQSLAIKKQNLEQEKDDPEETVNAHKSKLASTLSNMGCIYIEGGEYERALELLTEACEIREAVVPDTLELAVTYTNQGQAYAKLGRDGECFQKYMKARRIKEKVAPGTASLARTYLSLASVSSIDSTKKLQFLRDAEKIAEEIDPKPISLVANINVHRGHVYLRAKEPAKAAEYFERALLQEGSISQSSLTLASMLMEASHAYEALGNQSKANSYQRKANEIRKRKAPQLLECTK